MSARFMKCRELSLIRKAKPFPSAMPVPTTSHPWSMSLVSRLPRVPKESCVSWAQVFWRDTGICRKTRRRHSARTPETMVSYRDIVRELADGNYKFLGRRDRIIKKRGYRTELGEIEAVLYRHPSIKEAAVLVFPDDDGLPIKAGKGMVDGSKLSMIELKKFCSENLPLCMVPDLFCCLESLPKTSTDKIDYQKLKGMR